MHALLDPAPSNEYFIHKITHSCAKCFFFSNFHQLNTVRGKSGSNMGIPIHMLFLFDSFGPFFNFIFVSTPLSRKSKGKKKWFFLLQMKCSVSFIGIFQYCYGQLDNYTACLVRFHKIFRFTLIINYWC